LIEVSGFLLDQDVAIGGLQQNYALRFRLR
jgi:hypothetical protein